MLVVCVFTVVIAICAVRNSHGDVKAGCKVESDRKDSCSLRVRAAIDGFLPMRCDAVSEERKSCRIGGMVGHED